MTEPVVMKMTRARRFAWIWFIAITAAIVLLSGLNIAASYLNRHRVVSVISISEFAAKLSEANSTIASDKERNLSSSSSPNSLAQILSDNKDYRILISDTLQTVTENTFAEVMPTINTEKLLIPVSRLNFDDWHNDLAQMACSHATATSRRMRGSVLKCLIVLYCLHINDLNAPVEPLDALLGMLKNLGEEPTADSFFCILIGVDTLADLLQDDTFSAAVPPRDAVNILKCVESLMRIDYSTRVRAMDASLLQNHWYRQNDYVWKICESELLSNTLFATAEPKWISPFGKWAVLEVLATERPHWLVALSPIARAVKLELEVVSSREPILYSHCSIARSICEEMTADSEVMQ
jgi:hypothetical protein